MVFIICEFFLDSKFFGQFLRSWLLTFAIVTIVDTLFLNSLPVTILKNTRCHDHTSKNTSKSMFFKKCSNLCIVLLSQNWFDKFTRLCKIPTNVLPDHINHWPHLLFHSWLIVHLELLFWWLVRKRWMVFIFLEWYCLIDKIISFWT